MKASTQEKAKWMAGVVLAWSAGWLALGLRTWASIHSEPHPFLKGMHLTGMMLAAVIVWAASALLAYLVVGMISSLVALVVLGGQNVSPNPFRKGLLLGLSALFLLHGFLYLQVPGAMSSLPLIGMAPIALGWGVFLIPGFFLGLLAGRQPGRPWPWIRVTGTVLLLGLSLLVPHDLFRRFSPQPSALTKDQPRMALVSIDGFRRDTFEAAKPEWKAPSGCHPICAFPATRLAWNALLGAPIEEMRYAKVIPYQSELSTPDRLALLREAERRGIRTAFLIDDSLTPSYSLTPSLFSTVLEPEGGWRYWFTLGFGTSWPVYSWVQNFLAPVETGNAWCDLRAFYRDVGRQLESHHWVSSHTCELHAPIVLRFDELRSLSGWKWLGRSAYSYQPYASWDQLLQDKGARLGPRASAQRHYAVRCQRILDELAPFLTRWEAAYPNLSGVVTSDHGETFPPILTQDHQVASTFSGTHGFRLDADTLQVPLHPFGSTRSHLQAGELYSWLDLSANLRQWLSREGPLVLKSVQPTRIIQITAIQPAHLEGPGSPPAAQAGGVPIRELMRTIVLLPNGLWYCNDLDEAAKAHSIFSTALAKGTRVSLYNPERDGSFFREDWDGYRQLGAWPCTTEQMSREIEAFRTQALLPPPPKD